MTKEQINKTIRLLQNKVTKAKGYYYFERHYQIIQQENGDQHLLKKWQTISTMPITFSRKL